jgi:membrane-associated protease RseP (regulator of RpoE activity)
VGKTEKTGDDSPTQDLSFAPASGINEQPSVRPINKTEEKNLRDCFPWSVYYLENIEYRPQAVVCRGKLRSNPQLAYKTIRENIEAQFGDRFFVLFQESINSKPFFALVPNPQADPDSQQPSGRLTRPFLSLALTGLTLYTTTVFGSRIAGVSASVAPFDPEVLQQGLPYALALMAILGTHELGHYLCAIYYKIRTTLPYFIPVPFFPGTFGAFIQMRDPVPHRKALFDVGIAGPLAGLMITLPILIWGLAHSDVVSLTEKSNLLNFKSLNPRFSLLLTLLSKLALGSDLTPNMAINLHPVAVAGYIGLVVTAFNLMPVGQLDGGHIVHAMFGQRSAVFIGQIARLLMLLLSLVQPNLLLWAIILFFMPVTDQPCLNDVSELDNWRDFWGLLALVLLVSIILPPPATITQLLHV